MPELTLGRGSRVLSALDSVREGFRHGMVRALLLSVAAAVFPLAGAFLIPERLADFGALLWLLPLIPAFLLAYYKGWKGVATSLACGMALLSITYAVAQALGRGVPDLVFPVVVFYIAIALMIGWLAERLQRDVKREQPADASLLDAATGLPNRRHAELHLEIEFGLAQRGRPITAVLLQLDRFKSYNGRPGPNSGADVLRLVGSALRRTTRRLNLSARFGADQFLCLLGGSHDEGALVFMAAVQATLRDLGGSQSLPSISAGIATYRPSMRSWPELVSAAAAALELARKDGLGRVRVFGRPLQVASPATRVTEEEDPAERARRLPEGRGSGRRALVVVEEAPIRALLARYLTDHGLKVTQVSTLEDGVQCLTIEYDLLLTDISMMEGLGTELVRAAKLRWPSIQVIGLTELSERAIPVDVLNAGVDRFVEKPLNLPKLRQYLAELLARRDRLITSVLDNRQHTLEAQAEKAEAVSALRRNEEEYRTVVESLREIIFRVDTLGHLTFLNWAWTATTGHAPEDSLGRGLAEFVHAEDAVQLESTLRTLLTGDRDEGRTELRLLARDGSLRWAELRARRTLEGAHGATGVTGTMVDLTRSKHAEERLRRTEAASRALLAALPDQVFGLSRNGVLLSHSGGNGNNSESPVGKALEEVFPRGIAREYRQAVDRLFATHTIQICEYRLDNGHGQRQYEARFAMASDDEAVAIVRNVSERKRLEDQLRQGQKMEAIGRLAGGLAHDFNNLLTVVQGNAHLLIEEYGQAEEARGLAQEINSAAYRGAELVRQLLAFGRRQVMQPLVLNLNSVIASVHALLPRLIGEDIVIELALDQELGLVRADPSQFEQVIVNLAAYAKTRMPNGGTLRICTANVPGRQQRDLQQVSLPPAPLVRFTVSDSGPPLDDLVRAHAFEPFYGAVGSTPGGLGLATVYGIVTQSDGTILLEDAPGGGARFQVYLPRVDLS